MGYPKLGTVALDRGTEGSHTLLESVPAPAYACDADGRITYYNERAAALWGRRPTSADRYCGAHALLTAEGARVPRESCGMARALREGKSYQGREAVIVRPDGSRRTVLVYADPLHDVDGELVGATGLLIDLTQREKSPRTALRISERNFHGFFDSPAVGIVQVNADGRFTLVNDRYCQITGYSREELLSMGPFDLDHPEDRAEDVERVRQAVLDPAGIYHAEKRYVRKDGSFVWVQVAANFLRDDAGKVLHTAAIVTDIDERKRAETSLQEADRRKDDFLATLAHELRNPLAPLQNAVELLRHPPMQGSDRCRDIMARQIKHLTRLIDDLLDLSRITRDKLELRKHRTELAEVLSNAIEASRTTLERCEQVLQVELPPEPVHLDGDAVRLTQVFTNLLSNAAKFTESPGTIRLHASLEGAEVRVSVADSGIGIASEDLPLLFDKFYQSPRRGRQFVGGLGIGLSLVRRLVELHGGNVEARSAGCGCGSEFVVRLPAVRAVDTTASAAAAVTGLVRGRAQRILIVDDNRDGADSLGWLLELMGHEAVIEYDGSAALERSKVFAADVVFLDLGMPGMDGFEVCRRLRERPFVKRPSIVAMTGWGRDEDRLRTRHAGFDAHLVKPVDQAALERLLEGAGDPLRRHSA